MKGTKDSSSIILIVVYNNTYCAAFSKTKCFAKKESKNVEITSTYDSSSAESLLEIKRKFTDNNK